MILNTMNTRILNRKLKKNVLQRALVRTADTKEELFDKYYISK
jgi:hypothetical protein